MHYKISTLTAAIVALLMSQIRSTPLSTITTTTTTTTTTTIATMYFLQTAFGSGANLPLWFTSCELHANVVHPNTCRNTTCVVHALGCIERLYLPWCPQAQPNKRPLNSKSFSDNYVCQVFAKPSFGLAGQALANT